METLGSNFVRKSTSFPNFLYPSGSRASKPICISNFQRQRIIEVSSSITDRSFEKGRCLPKSPAGPMSQVLLFVLTNRNINRSSDLSSIIFIWKGVLVQTGALWSGLISPRLPRPRQRNRYQMCSCLTLRCWTWVRIGLIQCKWVLLTFISLLTTVV